jgi:methylmalonyl-CoA mutase
MSEDLFHEFPAADFQQWKARVEKELKGSPAESLRIRISDGLELEPYATERPAGAGTLSRLPNVAGDWCIADEIEVAEEKEANQKALEALNGGANALLFYLYPYTHAESLLKGIGLNFIHSHFVLEGKADEWAEKLLAIQGASEADICLNMDPIENLARSGTWFESRKQDFNRIKKLAALCPAHWRIFPVNGASYAYSGATPAMQLAILLASTHEYFVHFGEKALSQAQWNMAVGANYLEEMAKLRAARKLFRLLAHHLEVDQKKIFIHAESSSLYHMPKDAESNMLRNTAMAMAAVSGGADSVVVRSHDGSEEGSRLGRNIQLLMRHESYFGVVEDVAAGSFFIEKEGEALAEMAWSLFKEMEQLGGIISCLENGWLAEQLKNSGDAEIEKFRQGKTPLVGMNKYLKTGETDSYELAWKGASGKALPMLHWKKTKA